MAESLDLFDRMRAGEFPDAARTLRAKIDMASPNIWLRDPVLYRIRHAEHHHTGGKWCIYPMYDFAHCLSDYIEGITHSICTLEFEVHRPLYDWILENLGLPRPLPQQYEFAKLIPSHTIVSKRKLIQLVNDKRRHRLGRSPHADHLRPPPPRRHRRRLAPFRHRGRRHQIHQPHGHGRVRTHHPRRFQQNAPSAASPCCAPSKSSSPIIPKAGPRSWTPSTTPRTPTPAPARFPSAATLYIERDDFMETPPPKYFRLRPGGEVRLEIRLHHQVRRGGEGRRRRHRGIALHGRSGKQNRRRRRPTARSKAPSTGSAPPTPSTPKSASTTACSPSPNRTPPATSKHR